MSGSLEIIRFCWFNSNVSKPIKIALLHSYYSSEKPSGENIAVDSLASWLAREDRINLKIFSSKTPASPSIFYKIQAALRVAFGFGKKVRDSLEEFSPDVIHVHNLFPNFTKHDFQGLRGKKIITIHNYRSLCANGLLLRDNQNCRLCPEKSPFNAIRYSCYRGSRIATLPWYIGQLRDSKNRKFLGGFDTIIFLNHSVKAIFELYVKNFPTSVVIPNYIDGLKLKQKKKSQEDSFVLFAGNLSPEKGILAAVSSWKSKYPKLRIYGTGNEENSIRRLKKDNVELFGFVSNSTLIGDIRNAICVIIPSLCLENLPNIYVEALSQGTPILATAISIPGKLVSQEKTGIAFNNFSELEGALAEISQNRKYFSTNAHLVYTEKYSAKQVKEKLMDLYVQGKKL